MSNVRRRMPTYASAKAFIAAVTATYRALPAYSDVGHIRSFRRRDRVTCRFESSFRSPALFRFAFESPHPYRPLSHHVMRHVIGSAADGPYFFSRSYDGKARLERDEPLDMVVAGATGISRGSAHTIAALLFTEIGGFELEHLTRTRFRRNRIIGGIACKQVSGLHPAGGRITAFVGQDDLLLRKLIYARFKQEQLRYNITTELVHATQHYDAPVDA